IRFILNQGLAGEQTINDLAGPAYTAAFSGLAKAEYTLDAYEILGDGSSLSVDALQHDHRDHIGIGDIISVIGDSTSDGTGGTAPAGPVTNWLEADAGSLSLDHRNFPQNDPSDALFKESFLTDLNDQLSAYYGYPVFLMNEGHLGIRASNYQSAVMVSNWTTRELALAPTKWIVALGNGDSQVLHSAATYRADMESLFNTLIGTYGASYDDIYVPYPFYDSRADIVDVLATYPAAIDAMRSELGLGGGADFFFTFQNYKPAEYNGVHPNAAGYERIARLWALAFMQPTALTISAVTATQATVNWSSITAFEPTIAGYHVKYGTASNALTQTATFGDVTTGIVTGLTPNTVYYFAVEAYDNDANFASVSDRSNVLSTTTQSVASMASATTADTNTNGYLDSVVVTFSQDLDGSTIAGSDFAVSGYTISSASETAAGVVTIVLSEGPSVDTGATPLVTIVGSVSNASGNVTTSGALTPTDSALPILTSAVAQDIDANGYIDRVVALFSEDLDGSTVSGSDITVAGYVVTSASETSAGAVTIVFTEGSSVDT
ncbi:MAG: fibronectin type III domain-containing protein, partial [Patescibacteria group bacterium]